MSEVGGIIDAIGKLVGEIKKLASGNGNNPLQSDKIDRFFERPVDSVARKAKKSILFFQLVMSEGVSEVTAGILARAVQVRMAEYVRLMIVNMDPIEIDAGGKDALLSYMAGATLSSDNKNTIATIAGKTGAVDASVSSLKEDTVYNFVVRHAQKLCLEGLTFVDGLHPPIERHLISEADSIPANPVFNADVTAAIKAGQANFQSGNSSTQKMGLSDAEAAQLIADSSRRAAAYSAANPSTAIIDKYPPIPTGLSDADLAALSKIVTDRETEAANTSTASNQHPQSKQAAADVDSKSKAAFINTRDDEIAKTAEAQRAMAREESEVRKAAIAQNAQHLRDLASDKAKQDADIKERRDARDAEDRLKKEAKEKQDAADKIAKEQRDAEDRLKKDEKDRQDAAANAGNRAKYTAYATELEKINRFMPLVLELEIQYRNGNEVQAAKNKIALGIKSVVHAIPSDDLVHELGTSLQRDSLFLKMLRLTSGEISFIKDFVLNLSVAKKRAGIGTTPGRGLLETLRRQTEWNNQRVVINKSIMANTGYVPPTTTIVLTSNEVDQIRSTYGIDLTKTDTVRKILTSHNLIGFMIVDEPSKLVKIFEDGDSTFDRVPLEELKTKGKETSIKDILTLMTASR